MAQPTGLGTPSNVTYSGLTLHHEHDEDFYSFTARRAGTYVVAAQFLNARGNLDLFIYDAAGRLLASSATL